MRRIGGRLMAKRKQPKKCESHSSVIEGSNVPRNEKTFVCGNEASKEGLVIGWAAGEGVSEGSASIPAPVAATETVEMDVSGLEAFWSLLAEAGYTSW